MRYQLDSGPVIDLQPIIRPAGVARGTLALEVNGYVSDRVLLLQYAPRKGTDIVGHWQEHQVVLEGRCIAVELGISLGDGGVGGIDASWSVDGGLDLGMSGALDADRSLAIDQGDSQLDAPPAPDLDAPPDPAGGLDAAAEPLAPAPSP
jgi:hypothetical protein